MVIRPKQAASLRGARDGYLAEAATIRANRPALIATRDEAVMEAAKYEAADLKVRASVEREARLRDMAAGLEPQIAERERIERREDSLRRKAALVAKDKAEMREYAALEPVLAKLVDFASRRTQTQREIQRLNEELRAAGQIKTPLPEGGNQISTEPGFESIQPAFPAGWAYPHDFIDELHIPAMRRGAAPLWRARR